MSSVVEYCTAQPSHEISRHMQDLVQDLEVVQKVFSAEAVTAWFALRQKVVCCRMVW